MSDKRTMQYEWFTVTEEVPEDKPNVKRFTIDIAMPHVHGEHQHNLFGIALRAVSEYFISRIYDR